MLRPLDILTHPDLLTTFADDAAVYRLGPEQVMVQTVDFFTPIVDDPWTYGAIAAANALSDVYAMGARPVLALAIAALPDGLPHAMSSAIFQGGADKIAEAGAVLAGGHTVTDPEPKYGLCVTGLAHPDDITPKGGARPGDVLLLTKPLGTGIITTAFRRDLACPDDYDAAVRSMLRLNRRAAELAREAGGIHGATDITGFGLLGHAAELARNSGARLRFRLADLPLLPGTLEYVAMGVGTGGAARNRSWLADDHGYVPDPSLDAGRVEALFDPQTSGGLLLVLPPEQAEQVIALARAREEPMWVVGDVVAGQGVALI